MGPTPAFGYAALAIAAAPACIIFLPSTKQRVSLRTTILVAEAATKLRRRTSFLSSRHSVSGRGDLSPEADLAARLLTSAGCE